jgi:polysaccharide biosynthesis/export protein
MKQVFLAGLALLLGVRVDAAAWQRTVAEANPARSRNAADSSVPSRSFTAADEHGFVIGPEDVLAVNVWKEPEISHVVPVRPDGKITLPLVGDLTASGLTPEQLQAAISHKLLSYMSHPEVTVIVQEVKSRKVNVVGAVMKPGVHSLTTTMTVLDVIAAAGGFRDFAKVKKIYVLRIGPHGVPQRIAFNYKNVINGHNLAQNVELQPHDTIVVP